LNVWGDETDSIVGAVFASSPLEWSIQVEAPVRKRRTAKAG
jgi:hypothetical protein